MNVEPLKLLLEEMHTSYLPIRPLRFAKCFAEKQTTLERWLADMKIKPKETLWNTKE